MTPNKPDSERPAESVASPAENAKLEHTRGGATTRDDGLDAGVPMAPVPKGDREGYDHPGPEDALSAEPTRGDYRGRIDVGPHLQSVPVEPEDDVTHVDDQGKSVSADSKNVAATVREPGPRAKLVEQTPATPEG